MRGLCPWASGNDPSVRTVSTLGFMSLSPFDGHVWWPETRLVTGHPCTALLLANPISNVGETVVGGRRGFCKEDDDAVAKV